MNSKSRSASAGPLYDAVHLAGFTEGDRALEKVILSEFCANTRLSVSELESDRSSRSWGEAFHRLKGAAKAVGVWSIANWCDVAENQPDMASEEKAELFARILSLIEKIELHIERF